MKLRRAALMIVLLVAAAACQLLAGIGDDNFRVAPAPETIVDAGPTVDLCAHARPPPPPEPSDAASGKTYVFAIDDFDMSGLDDAGVAVGFDLDHACTCFDGRPTAHDGARSCAPPGDATPCDERDGIDNGFAAFRRKFSELGAELGLSTQFEAQQIKQINCGAQTMVLVVRDYNGMANDDEVLLGPVVSSGIRETLDGAPGVVGPGCADNEVIDGAPFAPKRDGTDVWSHPRDALRSGSTADDPIPNLLLPGYVSNYRLVFSYDDDQHKFALAFFGHTVSFGTPILTARLVPLDETNRPIPFGSDGNPKSPARAFALEDGVIGGRAKAEEIVAAMGRTPFGRFPDGGDILGCTSPVFPLVRDLMCGSVDIQSLGRNDFTSRPCDAFSAMFRFRAIPAHVHGERTPSDPDPASCPANFDTCPP